MFGGVFLMTRIMQEVSCGATTRRLVHRVVVAVLFTCGVFPAKAFTEKGPYNWALIRLDYARQAKVMQLRSFCDRMHGLARQAARDELVTPCFDINLQYSQAIAKGPVPEALIRRVAELREGFSAYYIQNYFAFYDILFVSVQGDVFYTIRKEADLGVNLLKDGPADSALVQCLKTVPREEAFVDFHYHRSSSKPAAFFVEPVFRDGVHLGWIVLQCAISKVNTLLAWMDELGQTGETFLVNRHGYMLTESNFEGASTILNKRLDDRNVQAKFAEGHGHRTVTDYRGRTALTSFEVVEYLGTKWLVVAKMDADEIVTDHYVQYRRYYADRLLCCLKAAPPVPFRQVPTLDPVETLQVDMDEFLKADSGQRLHTFGVSTCTGILAAYPDKFAYLAHISPKDKLYGSGDTNLLGPMIKRIKGFDIYRCQRHRVVFVVVARHYDTLLAIIDKLVEEGFLLSQIHVMCRPDAESATISYDYPGDNLVVTWRSAGEGGRMGAHTIADAVNAGQIIQDVMSSRKKISRFVPRFLREPFSKRGCRIGQQPQHQPEHMEGGL